MWKYLLKRIFIFIPTLFAISLISFLLSLNAPGDPVETLLGGGESSQIADRVVKEKQYLAKRKELGLNLPVFYFSLTSIADCDTLHRITKPAEKATLAELVWNYGNWDYIQEYYRSLLLLDKEAYATVHKPSIRQTLILLRIAISELRHTHNKDFIRLQFEKIESGCNKFPIEFAGINAKAGVARKNFTEMVSHSSRWKNYVPSVHWFGTKNQYHRWITGVFKGDFGISYYDQQPVINRLKGAIPYTLMLSISAILIAYFISIPLGIFSARNRNTGKDRAITTFLFFLTSLPSFWVATLLITFLCNPEYFYIFPSAGVTSDHYNDNWSLFEKISDYTKHLFLPTLCYTYSSIAFLSRQMRAGMLDSINQDYIRTARAKGLNERTVIWKHALKNSLIPIVTHFANVFPALVGGTVIIESIFAIPGMGRISISAIYAQDYPMIIAIFTLGAFMTMIGILVSDILYAVIDPRISFNQKK